MFWSTVVSPSITEIYFATLKPLPIEHRSTGAVLGLLQQLLHSQNSLKTITMLQLQILFFQHPVRILSLLLDYLLKQMLLLFAIHLDKKKELLQKIELDSAAIKEYSLQGNHVIRYCPSDSLAFFTASIQE